MEIPEFIKMIEIRKAKHEKERAYCHGQLHADPAREHLPLRIFLLDARIDEDILILQQLRDRFKKETEAAQ